MKTTVFSNIFWYIKSFIDKYLRENKKYAKHLLYRLPFEAILNVIHFT